MNKPKWVLMLILAWSFISCQDLKTDEQISKVSRLEGKTVEITEGLKQIQEDSIRFLMEEVRLVEVRIRKSSSSDTIDTILAGKLTEYKMIRKKLKPILALKAQLEKEIPEEKKALGKLKKDITHAAGEKGKYDEFITFEEEKVTQLTRLLNSMLENQKQCRQSFESLHQEMLSYSEHLINTDTAYSGDKNTRIK